MVSSARSSTRRTGVPTSLPGVSTTTATLRAAVAKEASGHRVGLSIVLDRDLTVHQRVAITVCTRDGPHLTCRQIVHELGITVRERSVVVHDDVRGRTLL